jgi:PAS domain S-box-containing protein
LTGWLAFYAWRHPTVPGARAYSGMMLCSSLLALVEIFPMLGSGKTQALFWFNFRNIFIAFIPVLWLLFAMEYAGYKDWISNRLIAIASIIPVFTQIIIWTNGLHGLWLKQDVGFHQNGLFWLAETSTRIPGLWFLLYSFYGILLVLVGVVVILSLLWSKRKLDKGQTLMLASGMLFSLIITLIPIFNLLPQLEFNPFTPGIGVSGLFYALAIFRFQFLKHTPVVYNAPIEGPEQRSLVLFVLIFLVMAASIAATGYLSYQNYQRQFRTQIESQLASIAAMKVDSLQNWRSERLADVRIFYKNPVFGGLVQRYFANPTDAQLQSELGAWLEFFDLQKQYDRISLLDPSGTERMSFPAISEAFPAHLIQNIAVVMSTRQETFLDFHRDVNGGAIHLALLVPIFAGQDPRPVAILLFRIDPNEYLYPLIRQWPISSDSAEALLLRREGVGVVFLNDPKFQPGAALNLHIPFENTQSSSVKAVQGSPGIVEGVDYRGKMVIADVRPVPDLPWFLEVHMDMAEIYAPIQERLWQTVFILAMLILTAGTGLGAVWRQQWVRFYRARYKTAEDLRESEEKFRKAFQITPDAIAITRLSDNCFVSVNQGFTSILGYLESEAVGKSSQELNLWVNLEDRNKLIAGLHANGIVENYEVVFRTKAGAICEGLMSAAIIELNGEPHVINSARDITGRKRAERALLWQNEYLTALQETTLELLSQMEPDILLENIVRRAGLLLDTSSGYLDLVDPETGQLKPRIGMGALAESLNHQAQSGEGVAGTVWQTGQPLVVNDYDHWAGRIGNYTRGVLAALIGVPLIYGGQVLGVLGLAYEFSTQRTFAPRSVEILTQFARLAAIAIENARLLSTTRQELAEHKRSEDLIRARLTLLESSASHSIHEILQETLDLIEGLTASSISFYHFLGSDQKTISLQSWSTRTVQEFCRVAGEGTHYPIDQAGVWIDCVHTKKTVIHNDYASLPHRNGLPEGHAPLIRELVVPILRSGLVVAILGVGNKPDNYTQADADFVAYFADVAWEIVERKQQEAQILLNQTKLEQLFKEADLSRHTLLSVVEDQKLAQEEIRRLNVELERRVVSRTAQLEASNKELEAFAYSVSHDLRAPLRAIDGFSNILEQEYAQNLDKEGLRLLGVIRNNAGKMDRLIIDLLALSRVSRSEINFFPVDMAALAKSVYHEIAAPETLEKFTFEVSALPHACGDPTLMRQVWTNLLSNAIKYTLPKEKCKIEINGWVEAGMCTYSIRDNGVGFDQKYTDKLFGLFQRLHKAGEFEGTGVGLAIVQRIIHRHGGQIWGEGQVGTGATFYFTIPERHEVDE